LARGATSSMSMTARQPTSVAPFLGDLAALRAPLEEPRGADPDPLSQRRLYRRLRRSTARLARQGCRRAFSLDHRETQGRLVGRTCALEQARSVRQALRLLLGRRHPRPGSPGGRSAVLARHHWRHARGHNCGRLPTPRTDYGSPKGRPLRLGLLERTECPP
jgi:hypothetical protein